VTIRELGPTQSVARGALAATVAASSGLALGPLVSAGPDWQHNAPTPVQSAANRPAARCAGPDWQHNAPTPAQSAANRPDARRAGPDWHHDAPMPGGGAPAMIDATYAEPSQCGGINARPLSAGR
jgi:hypothetical protein